MLNKIISLTSLAVLAILLLPSEVDAWGAAHVGVTRVGPNGVYHAGRTAVAGPAGVRVGGHASAVGYGGGACAEPSCRIGPLKSRRCSDCCSQC